MALYLIERIRMFFFIQLIINLIRLSRNLKRLNKLNELRSPNNLDEFIFHYEDQGIAKKVIEIMIEKLRVVLHYKEFIPSIDGSFLNDYNWKYFYSDEYSTNQMRLAAYVMDEINQKDLKESYWLAYEKEYGEIDNFQHLFHFISIHNDIMTK